VKVQQFSYFVSRILLEYIFLLHFDPNDDEISQRVDVEVLWYLEDIATHEDVVPKRLKTKILTIFKKYIALKKRGPKTDLFDGAGICALYLIVDI
jgi:hypothetical protein